MSKIMQFYSSWRNMDIPLWLKTDTYANNKTLAIRAVLAEDLEDMGSRGEPYAMLTVNLPGGDAAGNRQYVDTNNWHGAEELIRRYGLGKFTGKYGGYGFCEYPLYEFDMNRIAEFLYED